MNSQSEQSGSISAIVGLGLIGAIGLLAAVSIVTGSALWGMFLLTVIAVVLIPPVKLHDWTAMVPWPIPAVVAVAAVARVAGVYVEAAGYLAIVALALIIVIELDVFTPVDLSRRFAIIFGVMMTMALQALWIITQNYWDVWFGTDFLKSQTELQWDIVVVTVVAVAMGVLYQWYSVRFDPTGSITVQAGRNDAQ